ncbi:hypothetical protein ACI6KS_003652 [Vibrio parahaemolyticus]|uniref:hypothetical protein n=2 Tax=Vibrio parahaemolyticus TaxID=670 RepID=UPI0023618F64|nr:hypothetical protein [Vibrio parahaemolyticus]
MVSRYCECCKTATEHKETLERKPSSYDENKSIFGRLMLLVHEFINGGHYYNMNRYLVCKICRHKVLDNMGNEFE